MIQFLGEWLVRSSILILAGSLVVWLTRAKNPEFRLTAWIALLAGSFAIPLVAAVLPKVPMLLIRAPGMVSATALLPAPARSPAILPSPRILDSRGAPVPLLPANAKPFDRMRFAAVLYALPASALLLRLFVGLVISLRIFRRSHPTGIVAERFEVRESGRVASPVTIGVLRSAVLLPLDWRTWDSAKLEAVMAHERSHIRRRDPAAQFVSAIHRAVLWASPASWFLHRCIVRTAEQISDDDAVAATHDRLSYAEILLEFVQRGAGQTSWQGVPMASYDRPEKRIRRILNSTAVPRGVTRWGVAAIMMLAAPLAYLAAAVRPQSATLTAPRAVPVPVPLAPPAPAAVLEPVEAPTPTPAPNPAQIRTTPSSAVLDQTAAELPQFEVASVKPTDPGVPHSIGVHIYPGGRLEILAVPLKTLVATAFGLSSWQISGGDAWIEKDEYDIEAKPPENLRASIKSFRWTWFGIQDDHLRGMLQALLMDRFQLRFHREAKTGDVYLLERSGKMLRLRPVEITPSEADPTGYSGFESFGYAGGRWDLSNAAMPQLAKFAADFILHLPVEDRTELSGLFHYRQAVADLEPKYDDDQSESFISFLSELGLKLERTKGPVEQLVIDHAAKPSPN